MTKIVYLVIDNSDEGRPLYNVLSDRFVAFVDQKAGERFISGDSSLMLRELEVVE